MATHTPPAALLAELAALRKQNALQATRLQRAGASRRQERIDRMADRATLDALALITLAVGGGDVGRTVAPLPQRRWAHAIALLRLAGLAHGRTVTLTLAETPQATLERVQRAATLAKAQPARWGACHAPYARPDVLR